MDGFELLYYLATKIGVSVGRILINMKSETELGEDIA